MGYRTPDKAVPAGCVLALVGFGAYVYAAVYGYFIWKILSTDKARELLAGAWIRCLGGIALGTFLIWWGRKMALRADMSDPDNRGKPKIRF